MHSKYHAIYLSPHLDDAALSCGGQIAQLSRSGKRVLIVTIMAGDPPARPLSAFAQTLHGRWQLQRDVVAARRREDIAACDLLGVDYYHGSVPDCIYRLDQTTGQALYVSNDDIFGRVHQSDLKLVDEIAELLRILPAHDLLVAPLGVGNHVDHQVSRSAAEQTRPDQLVYYEDYPYAAVGGAVQQIIDQDEKAWQSETIPLSDSDKATKVAAIAAFESQLSSFFTSHADLVQAVADYSLLVGGERNWRICSSSKGRK